MLAQEPWCFPPAIIAGLTDFQIEHVYVRPAVERAKRSDPNAMPEHDDEHDPFRHGIPPVEQFITMMLPTGHDAKYWGEVWTRLKAEEAEAKPPTGLP